MDLSNFRMERKTTRACTDIAKIKPLGQEGPTDPYNHSGPHLSSQKPALIFQKILKSEKKKKNPKNPKKNPENSRGFLDYRLEYTTKSKISL